MSLALLALAKLAIQFAGITRYGFFRDELYYVACGEHLAWGYVDQPPLIAFAAWFARHLFGNSIISFRLLPALAGAAVVFLTGVLARELGGGASRKCSQRPRFCSRRRILRSTAFFR